VSRQENIFLATTMTVAEVAKLITSHLGLFPVSEQGIEPDAEAVGLRGPALDHDGFDLLLTVKMNEFSTPNPPPEDVQSFDPYRINIEAWVQPGNDEVQVPEARGLFDRLVLAAPTVASQLVTNLSYLAAAYLPGAGTHFFEPDVTPDIEDQGTWLPWSVTPSAS
jgi:hypothetical protein